MTLKDDYEQAADFILAASNNIFLGSLVMLAIMWVFSAIWAVSHADFPFGLHMIALILVWFLNLPLVMVLDRMSSTYRDKAQALVVLARQYLEQEQAQAQAVASQIVRGPSNGQ